MLQAAVAVLFVMLVGAAGVVAAFFWAAREGQFEDIEEGSGVIFDPAEPIGEATDRFPGEKIKKT
ncbi:cbb3-type cytochrome oxidase assembly protein (plasmid) [Verrucomicrobiaceae bacterium 227]